MNEQFALLEQKYQLPSGLLDSVYATESSRNPKAIGPQTKYGTAKGGFQFIDDTAKAYGVNDPFNLEQAAEGAAKMYADLSKQYGGDLDKMLAGYNWGSGNIAKHGMDKMPQETIGYIEKVKAGLPQDQSEDIFPNISDDDFASLEAEFGSVEQEISQEDFAALEAEFGDENTNLESFAMGGVDGVSMGSSDEVSGFSGGLTHAMSKLFGNEDEINKMLGLEQGSDYSDAYNKVLDSSRAEHKKAREDNPFFYGGGQVTGAIAGATGPAKGLSSVSRLQKYARANPFKTSSAVGGISGAVYGGNSSEGDARERLEAARDGGLFGAVAGPAVHFASKPLLGMAQKLFSKPNSVNQAVKRPASNLVTSEQAAKMQSGEILPMTKGQVTQSPKLQSLEQSARKGAIGDNAQDLMMRSDLEQQGAIRGVFDEIGIGEADDLTKVGRQLQGAYKSQKAQVGNAYDSAKSAQGVYVNKQPLVEQFIPRVKDVLKDGGFDLDDLSPAGKKVIDSLNSPTMNSKNITAVNLEKMEFWRRKVSNNIANNNAVKGNAAEGVAMKKILEQYDTFMAKLPEDALKSGDEKALEAINKARGLRRKQGVLFERDKVVKKIVQSQDLTDEELANMVITGSSRSEKVNTGSGKLVKNLKRAVGDKAPELQEGLKRGTLARVLQKGTTTVTEGNSSIRMLSPAKLRGELDLLVKNKTFMNEVFTTDEIKKISAMHRDLIKIGSEQAGTNNYSNTAYALMRGLNSLPMGLSAIGGATAPLTKAVGNKSAEKALKKNLSPILDSMIDDLASKTRFYGAVGSAPISEKIQNTKE